MNHQTTEHQRMRTPVPTLLASAALAVVAPMLGHAQDEAPPPQDWIEVPLGEHTFQEFDREFRTDVIDIPLAPSGELEYKLEIEEGDAVVYEWNVVEIEDPELLYSEFHGHTERVGSEPGTLMFYRKASGGSERGMLVAPFTGIHGWYLRNEGEEPFVVRLKVSGFYDLLPQ
jgi:hypothetical protein